MDKNTFVKMLVDGSGFNKYEAESIFENEVVEAKKDPWKVLNSAKFRKLK